MTHKSELEKTIEYAIGGVPQIKADEKRKWLGEFRERIIFGLNMDQVNKSYTKEYIENALKDPMAEIIIVNHKIPMDIISKYMKLARDMNKEFKTVMANNEDAMGIVVASSQAVERENVEIEIEEAPEKLNEVKDPKDKESVNLWNRLSRIFKK